MIVAFSGYLHLYFTLKPPVTTKADENLLFFLFYFSEKTSLDISCESSAWHSHEMSRLVSSEK